MTLLRMCNSRSAVQNCSAVTVCIQYMEYSLAIGQYCEASMVLVDEMNTIMKWLEMNNSLVYIWEIESIGMKRVPNCAWWISDSWAKPLVHVLWCASMCLIYISVFKGENILFLKCQVLYQVLYMNYLSVRPLVLSNTLSHIWDRLNLPMLLFKEGFVNPDVNRFLYVSS